MLQARPAQMLEVRSRERFTWLLQDTKKLTTLRESSSDRSDRSDLSEGSEKVAENRTIEEIRFRLDC